MEVLNLVVSKNGMIEYINSYIDAGNFNESFQEAKKDFEEEIRKTEKNEQEIEVAMDNGYYFNDNGVEILLKYSDYTNQQ